MLDITAELQSSIIKLKRKETHFFQYKKKVHGHTLFKPLPLSRQNLQTRHQYFSYFSQKTEFDMSCKLSPVETICMKCQILFSGKKKKKENQNVIC